MSGDSSPSSRSPAPGRHSSASPCPGSSSTGSAEQAEEAPRTAGAQDQPDAQARAAELGGNRRWLSRGELLSAIAAGACIGLAGVGAWWAFQPAVSDKAASLCRAVIPALNSAGASFDIGPPIAGALDRSMRISYLARLPDGRLRRRELACKFAIDNDDSATRLIAVATERGPLSDTHFYFLRRFYLEADDGPPPDPAASQATGPHR